MGTQIPRNSVSPWLPRTAVPRGVGRAGVLLTGTRPRTEVGSEMGEGQGGALAVLMSPQIISQKASLLW